MQVQLVCRPFLNSPQLGYELVLVRTDGGRAYDRRLAILSDVDAIDIADYVPQVKFVKNEKLT